MAIYIEMLNHLVIYVIKYVYKLNIFIFKYGNNFKERDSYERKIEKKDLYDNDKCFMYV